MKKSLMSSSVPNYITFLATLLALSGVSVITALTTFSKNGETNNYLQNALISQTGVTVITAVIYYYFLKYLNEGKLTIEKVTPVRYIDWFITTPFILFSFVLYTRWIGETDKDLETKIDLIPLIYIIGLCFLMLIFGFLGETGVLNKIVASIFGFFSFVAMMYFVYDKYIDIFDDEKEWLRIIYGAFVAIWLLYLISYCLSLKYKNISYNILDIISKAGFGILIWISLVMKEDPIPTSTSSFYDEWY